jgi:hypothetical protein
MYKIMLLALCWGLWSVAPGSPLIRTIGRTNSLSAKIMIETTDTNQKAFDSICPRYWYVRYISTSHFPQTEFFDYRITIYRKASEQGSIVVFSPFSKGYSFDKEILSCDSLGFRPDSTAYKKTDTIKADTTVFLWIYPRVAKRRAVKGINLNDLSNHLKIRLSSKSVNDSIILTREKKILGSVIENPLRYNCDKYFTKKVCIGDNRFVFFDTQGKRITPSHKSSHVIILVSGLKNDGPTVRRVNMMWR